MKKEENQRRGKALLRSTTRKSGTANEEKGEKNEDAILIRM